MIDLNQWSLEHIKLIAKELGIKTTGSKAIIIEKIQSMNLSDEILSSIVEKYPKTTSKSNQKSLKVGIKSTTKSSHTSDSHIPSTIDQRIQNIEEQIKYIMQKLSQIEVRLASEDSRTKISLNRISEIKSIILEDLQPGSNIKVDDLLQKPSLTNYSFEQIESAVIELIDEERLDFAEGSSKKKFRQTIARIIRR